MIVERPVVLDFECLVAPFGRSVLPLLTAGAISWLFLSGQGHYRDLPWAVRVALAVVVGGLLLRRFRCEVVISGGGTELRLEGIGRNTRALRHAVGRQLQSRVPAQPTGWLLRVAWKRLGMTAGPR